MGDLEIAGGPTFDYFQQVNTMVSDNREFNTRLFSHMLMPQRVTIWELILTRGSVWEVIYVTIVDSLTLPLIIVGYHSTQRNRIQGPSQLTRRTFADRPIK